MIRKLSNIRKLVIKKLSNIQIQIQIQNLLTENIYNFFNTHITNSTKCQSLHKLLKKLLREKYIDTSSRCRKNTCYRIWIPSLRKTGKPRNLMTEQSPTTWWSVSQWKDVVKKNTFLRSRTNKQTNYLNKELVKKMQTSTLGYNI